MDDDKRTVVVAALSAYAGLLGARRSELALEQGKGKGKASQDDVDLTAEIQNQIVLCGELTGTITNASSGKDIARTFEPAGVGSQHPTNERELESLKREFEESPGTSNSHTENDWRANSFQDPFQDPYPSSAAVSNSKPEYSSVVDNEPYNNPFTGLPVIPETGFEAGPSSRPPLRKPPRLPSVGRAVPQRTLSMQVEPKQESPMPPLEVPLKPSVKPPTRPPKPLHLQSRYIAPPRPTETPEFGHARMNSIKRKPTPTETQPLQWRFTEPPTTTPEYGLTPMSSVKQKPIATGPRADMFSPEPYDPPADTSSVSLHDKPPKSLSDLETNIQVSRKEIPEDGIHGSSPAHKRKYFRHIADLASKAIKAAGSMMTISRIPSVHQSQSLSPQEAVNTPAEPPDYTSIAGRNAISHVATRPPKETPQRRDSEESLPPAYNTLSHITQRPFLASIHSVARGGTWTPSTVLSSRPSISSLSNRAASPSVASPTRYGFQRRSSRSQPRFSPNITADINESSTRVASATSLSNEETNFSLTSPVASPGVKLQTNGPKRRNTVSSSPKPPTPFGNFTDDQVAGHISFAQNRHVDNISSTTKGWLRVSSRASPGINPGGDQWTGNAQKWQCAASPPQNHRNSNNPWKDYMTADFALARTLQQEEYRALQTDRDELLAVGVANGTAEDEDFELAYYMSLETARLIELTEAVTAGPHTPKASAQAGFDPPVIDREIQLHHDLLEALRAEDASDEASFSAAKRLQAELDKESHDENASWEEWKKSNIEECIVCGDEQHREELARPCEHGYCDGCLQAGFEAAMASKTPFKCCQKVLDINDCPGLQPEFVAEYEEMMMELSTPNPMYCHNARCAKFLPPRAIAGDIGTCESCKNQTCRHCKQQAHPGTFCREDKETEAVKNLGRAKGWKTCPGCNHLIERQSGCLHMVCSRCQTAFCYRCSKRWKDCESTCPDRVSATHPKI